MNIYPLKQINRDLWEKKVNSTSMFTIPAEDQALPVLHQIDQILTRLMTLPIQQTLSQDLIPYFFTGVFPPVCQKIIKSRNTQVLKISNCILQKSVYLIPKHLDLAIKNSKSFSILINVFSDQPYFKTNNQLNYMIYPYSYFLPNQKQFKAEIGDLVDIIKIGNLFQKVTWSQGKIIAVSQQEYEVKYLHDGNDKMTVVSKKSHQIAPFKTKSYIFQWRKSLKAGDLIDVQDSYGSWFNATVLQVIEKEKGKKNIKVTLKVYNQNGNKFDQRGNYYGLSQNQETFDFTSPKIAPYCSVARQFCYESGKMMSYDTVDDINDYQFLQMNGDKIYAFPRKKNLSEFQFKTINGFGSLGGFDKILNYLQNQVNFDVFCSFVKGISGAAPYLHRQLVKNLVERIKALLQKYLFDNQEKTTKYFTKQLSQIIYSGMKTLLKRLYTHDNATKYTNQIKMRLVDICLQSQSLKSKLQGLNQLKDVVKSVSYLSQRYKYKQWIKVNKFFEKIYIVNSHVQLIKKSEEFFKYLITQNILQLSDLQKLYRMAQKGDFESRVSIYKLFQQVSHNFRKQHGQFLIDTILESQLHLVLNQDIDLLHQLSRFSNYYPLQKVFKFFQNIILGDNKTKQLNDYATKKYSQIVAKNSQAKPYRQAIIKKFIQKLQTHEIGKIIKILKGIFQGMAIGQLGKKQLNQVVCEQKLDEVLTNVLRKSKGQNQFNKNLTLVLDFLLFIYKLNYKVTINISMLTSMWEITLNEQSQIQFYRWANQLCKCQQGIQAVNIQQLESFCRRIYSSQIIPSMTGVQFELAKNIFVQINKKIRSLSVSNVFKDRDVQKEYKRKTQLNELKLIDLIIQMIYKIKQSAINNQALSFFIQLYNSRPNSQKQIDELLNKLLQNFKEEYEAKNYNLLVQTIKLMDIVINDSQKNVQTNIKSLISKKQPDYAKFIIINQCNSFVTDSMKKSELTLPMNMPIIKVRKLLGKQLKLSWQQIKIVSSKEIQDYENSRTLKQIKLNPNQPLTVSRRIIISQIDQQLILNDKLNPKAVRCFKYIFQNYSTNGKMTKDQCNSFTAVCLGSSGHVRYDQKISNLYKNYDDDHDDLLSFQNFLKFYEDAARDKAHTVWSNLKSFGVRGNFKFPHEPDQVFVQKYPRNVIAQYPKVYEILFDLLHVKEVASVAFELLERLPVSSVLQDQLLNIQSKQDLVKILDSQDLYKLFYRLNLIQYLAHSSELQTQIQKSWHKKFIQLEGYELLYDCIEKICLKFKKQQISTEEQFNQIIRQIFETSLNLLNQFWVQCFSKDVKKLRTSLALLSSEQEIDDKMDYLLFDRFIRNQKKIQPTKSKLPQSNSTYVWKGKQKLTIIKFLLQQLQNKWLQVCKIKNSELTQRKYDITMLLFKVIDALNILLMNQNPQNLAQISSNLFDQTFSNQLIRRFYCLILSLCFYSQIRYQGILIRQLFKNLTKRTITSEHFRVLAVLVSKFGIQSSGDQGQSTQMLTSVLLDNVLTNKNELTIEGCAKLLTNFYLKGIQYEVFERIWNERLFNPETICQKDQSRSALYGLILKLCDHNPGLIQKISKKVIETLQKEASKMKITYCNEYKQRSATGYAGLKNLGNTCYINSIIQQLYMNRNFRYCILRADDQQKPNLIDIIDKNQLRTVDDNFLHQVQRIFANLQLTTRIDFAPKDFCVAYKPFGSSVDILIQQDVQEFISMFFDRLQSGLSKTMFKKLVQDFYTGKTVNLFKCHSCAKTKKVEQSFYSISLQVKTSKTLAQSFNRFCHGEMINDYKCDFCNNKVDVTKKTRISKIPKTLVIHLQRIVFNLDTFINQKISTKHSFPHSFNLHQTTLDFYERSEAGQTNIQQPKEYNYNLIGIICHSGTAQSGHYICYIKTHQNKWIQFNDSQVTSFSASNIQSQCFGGSYSMASAYDEQYFDQKKQSSKSAYLLIYEKEGADTIELILKNQLQNCKNQKQRQKLKKKLLQSLDLKQVIQKIEDNKEKESKPNKQSQKNLQMEQNTPSKMTQDREQSSSAPQDSQKQTKLLLEAKQLEIKRHQSQDNIQTDINELNKQNSKQQKPKIQEMTIQIQQPVNPYIPQKLRQQIVNDNVTHFMEKCLSSTSFVKFFSQLISLSNNFDSYLLNLCKKLTFGFWLKSPSFKDLLSMLDDILKRYPQGFQEVVTNNPIIINLLIQSSDADVRTCMANFLAKVIADTIQTKGINICDNKDDLIFKFLDKLFSLLPSTVSKCWTKFGQYFQFWYQLSTKGLVVVEYMLDRQIIKHFMDYFLDTKSPLKIYATKRQHQIGSSYANPNFSMLLKCVSSLLQLRMIIKGNTKQKITNNQQEQSLLMSHDSLQKLINDKYQNIAAQLVKQICPHNLQASQKVAVVLLKGISKSSSDTVQPYLEVLHQFALIEDQYQDLRIKWVIGRQTLAVSTLSLKIIAMNSYSLQQRIHHFEPSLQVQTGSSVLQLIIIYHKRIQTYAMLCTRQILRLCDQRKNIRKLIFNLQSPTLILSKYTDFFRVFIDKYVQDQRRSYGFYSSSTGFNREQFSKQVKVLYEKVMVKVLQDQKQQQIQQLQTIIGQGQSKQKEKENNLQNQMKKQQKKQQGQEKVQSKENQGDKEAGRQQNIQFIDQLPMLRENSSTKQQVQSNKLTTSDQVLSQNIMEIQLLNINQNPQHVINQSQQQLEQPLLKQRKQYKSTTTTKCKQKQVNKDYKQTWHPIKFEYKCIKNNHELAQQFSNFYIEQHESIVTYLLTKPTGSTNRSFTNKGGVQKTSQRLLQEAWQHSKQVKVHGYYAKNYSKQSFRIQTNEGCVHCKAGQNAFIWADQILRVWVAQKSGDWPKWRLFDKGSINKQKQK